MLRMEEIKDSLAATEELPPSSYNKRSYRTIVLTLGKLAAENAATINDQTLIQSLENNNIDIIIKEENLNKPMILIGYGSGFERTMDRHQRLGQSCSQTRRYFFFTTNGKKKLDAWMPTDQISFLKDNTHQRRKKSFLNIVATAQ